MSSGGKAIQINPQERAISPDINRLQKFLMASFMEHQRLLTDVSAADDSGADGLIVEHATITTPLRALVIAGLMVSPELGNFTIDVTEGLLFTIDPDGAADDSNYKYIADTGLSGQGSLTLTPNAGPGRRLDIIEVQPVLSTNLETQSRDIFNPISGNFVPTNVPKVTAGQLTYRVRTGTPGGGLPALALGWLPLAVVMVPAGAASNDACMFWDVRPLIADRVRAPMNISSNKVDYIKNYPFVDTTNTNAGGAPGVVASLRGEVIANHLGAYAGGNFSVNRSRIFGQDYDLANASGNGLYNDPGLVVDGATPMFVYALFPGSLPRWCQYTEAFTGSRVPGSVRGIICASSVAANAFGLPSSGVGLPTLTGLTGTTTSGALIAFVPANSSDHSGPGIFQGIYGDGSWVTTTANSIADGGGTLVTGVAVVQPNNAARQFTFSDASKLYPANAKAIRVLIIHGYHFAIGGPVGSSTIVADNHSVTVETLYGSTDPDLQGRIFLLQPKTGQIAAPNSSGTVYNASATVEIPIPSPYSTFGALISPNTIRVIDDLGSNLVPPGNVAGYNDDFGRLYVLGYKLLQLHKNGTETALEGRFTRGELGG